MDRVTFTLTHEQAKFMIETLEHVTDELGDRETIEGKCSTAIVTTATEAMNNTRPHFIDIYPYATDKTSFLIGQRRRKLYRGTCRCGFQAEAYGKTECRNQLEGHLKTMWPEL